MRTDIEVRSAGLAILAGTATNAVARRKAKGKKKGKKADNEDEPEPEQRLGSGDEAERKVDVTTKAPKQPKGTKAPKQPKSTKAKKGKNVGNEEEAQLRLAPGSGDEFEFVGSGDAELRLAPETATEPKGKKGKKENAEIQFNGASSQIPRVNGSAVTGLLAGVICVALVIAVVIKRRLRLRSTYTLVESNLDMGPSVPSNFNTPLLE